MKSKICWLVFFLLFSLSAHSQPVSEKIVTGEKLKVTSAILNYSPEIFISLPFDYSDSAIYPVVVILDAEWSFATFAGITRLMGQMEEIPPCIVVGISLSNSFEQYGVEYAPEISGLSQSGHADKILQFYQEELFPLVDSLYEGSGEKIIWAHSVIGGLFCTYLLLGNDTQFSGILSSSPNLKFVQEYIKRENAFEALAAKGKVFYYLSFGTDEEDIYMGDMFRQVETFANKLAKEAPSNLVWVYRLNEHNNHFTNAIESYVDGLKLYFQEMERW